MEADRCGRRRRRRRRSRGIIGGGVVGILLETGRGVHLRRRSLFSILFLF
jgi:hypothetical protein